MSVVGIGLRAQKGGAVVVGVCVEASEPRVLLSTFLQTCTDGDRLSFEPYRVAAAMARGPQGGVSAEAAAAVAEGRGRQSELAAKNLQDILHRLQEARHKPAVAALLVNRAGWITDLLEYSLAWRDHVPVAEGLAVRDALRFGISRCGVELAELDEKSLPDRAARTLRISSAEIDARLKALGTTTGRPWRKEQKLTCLSAWVVAAGRR